MKKGLSSKNSGWKKNNNKVNHSTMHLSIHEVMKSINLSKCSIIGILFQHLHRGWIFSGRGGVWKKIVIFISNLSISETIWGYKSLVVKGYFKLKTHIKYISMYILITMVAICLMVTATLMVAACLIDR